MIWTGFVPHVITSKPAFAIGFLSKYIFKFSVKFSAQAPNPVTVSFNCTYPLSISESLGEYFGFKIFG